MSAAFEHVLQVRARNLSNVTNPVTGEAYDPAMCSAQYRDTPFSRKNRREANALLESAKSGQIGAYQPAHWKFRITKKPITAETIPH